MTRASTHCTIFSLIHFYKHRRVQFINVSALPLPNVLTRFSLGWDQLKTGFKTNSDSLDLVAVVHVIAIVTSRLTFPLHETCGAGREELGWSMSKLMESKIERQTQCIRHLDRVHLGLGNLKNLHLLR